MSRTFGNGSNRLLFPLTVSNRFLLFSETKVLLFEKLTGFSTFLNIFSESLTNKVMSELFFEIKDSYKYL